MSSQKYIQNFSKGASRFKDLLWEHQLAITLVVVPFVGLWVFNGLDEAMQALWAGCWGAIVFIVATAKGYRELREEKEKLEDEISSFPATEFMEGMNAFGVETLLGGGDPFGPQADIRLRFPATQLHKHLVDAMVHGYTAAYIREQAPLSTEDVEEIRNQVDRLAWRWIEEMTKGLR